MRSKYIRAGTILGLSLLAACTPALPPSRAAADQRPLPSPPPQPQPQPTNTASIPDADAAPARAPRLVRKTLSGIVFEGVEFDSRSHRLEVIDQPDGPGSAFATAADAASKKGALLVINAGFFTPEGKPLGLVIARGKRAGSWNAASSLGSAVFTESGSGRLSISRRTSPRAAVGATELIQAGPLLLEGGRRITGLDGSKAAVRSIILTDGVHKWWIGGTTACTLASLGQALASGSPTSWRPVDAMNLDGGRSTDLFVSSAVSGGPLNRRGFLNRPVRNFLVLTSR